MKNLASHQVPAGAEILAPDQYQNMVADQLKQTIDRQIETVSLDQTLGRTLTASLIARENLPYFANSQMDGYALTAEALDREDRTFEVGADVAAGSAPPTGQPSADIVLPIMTGAALPDGYVAVVPEEQTQPLGTREGNYAAQGTRVRLPKTPHGQFVRTPGEDIREGEQVATAGDVVTPALLGALAAQGITEVPVFERLRVLLVTGGDEVAQGSSVKPGQIRDANGPVLRSLVAQDGAHSERLKISDSPQELIRQLRRALADFDPHLIISSGGISHGKYEVVRNTIDALSAQNLTDLGVKKAWFGHVSQQPGGPQGLITLHHSLAKQARQVSWVALPGNPVSTLISYVVLLREVISARSQPDLWATLDSGEDIEGLPAKTQFRRARVQRISDAHGLTFLAVPDPQTGSHLLHRAAQANALARIEPATTYLTGDKVRWYPLHSSTEFSGDI
ncbi:MAG: molybdopterin molybdotransferase MoeA [Rothia sp. (in: high G+C Gram-positive bacteria)]|nr:molybdopterin molybdotransferase MoeA [Rothia sp. (in: high G+C Gram-positive bacteria)]